MRLILGAALALAACSPPGNGPPDSDGGTFDGGGVAPDGGATDGGGSDDFRFVSLAGMKCALGARAGIGYARGDGETLVLFLQGGGACWNDGSCHPSLFQWGPVCNYASNSVCLYDDSGGTKPLAAHVAESDPFPADGGGAFPGEIAVVKSSLLFTRRPENPLAGATYVYVPYCTGDLHAGSTQRTYSTRAGAFDPVVPVTHHFAGAQNMDAVLAYLRALHPSVRTLWLTGISGGAYGATLNFERVRTAFPEAAVHLLADSAPMVPTVHFSDMQAAWGLPFDAGFPAELQRQLDSAPAADRIGLLAYTEDAVLTRFFFSPDNTNGWLNPPYASYSAALAALESKYEASPRARYFILPGQTHVMLPGYGSVQADGGITAPVNSVDGSTNLKAWVDAWATGTGSWTNEK